MQHDTRIVDVVLGALSPDERLASLICSVIERRPQAMSALVSMAAVIAVMAQHLNGTSRIALAEILRDTADNVEHERRQVVHIN
jgi:hypothetical protein